MQSRNYKIVAIDDVDRNIILIEAILAKSDFNIDVKSALDGESGIALVQQFKPDLVLLDVMMPDMSGFEVCKRLRSEPKTGDIPIIFLTALSEVDSILKGLSLGAIDYILKPFHKDVLLSRITNYLKLVETQISLNKSLKELDTLVRVLCHDLKNPIAGGKELLDCFMETHPELKEDDILQHVEEAFKNSLGIIKNVSLLSQMGHGQLELEIRNVPLKEMVLEALSIVSTAIEKKDIKVSLDIAADCYLEVDSNAFVNSVIVNALTNSIKFSDRGGLIEVVDFSDDNEYGFVIRDYGEGMPANVVEHLIAGDEIASSTGTMGETGTGYGLQLMKRFSEMFGAKMRVVSSDTNPGQGFVGTNVTFYFNPE